MFLILCMKWHKKSYANWLLLVFVLNTSCLISGIASNLDNINWRNFIIMLFLECLLTALGVMGVLRMRMFHAKLYTVGFISMFLGFSCLIAYFLIPFYYIGKDGDQCKNNALLCLFPLFYSVGVFAIDIKLIVTGHNFLIAKV